MSDLPYTTNLYIRATHPNSFRSGQWAKVISVRLLPDQHKPFRRSRPVYLVEFVDGRQDQWPVYDADAGYEFASGVISSSPTNKKEES
jgi:hypothetical protein